MSRSIFSILLLFIAAGAFVFGVIPAWNEMGALRKEIQGSINLNDELQEIALARDELTAQYNAIPQANLQKLSSVLPSGLATSQFLRDMEALANRHGMFLKSIDFVRREERPDSRILLPSQQASVPVNVSLAVKGQYASFRSFLNDLEKMIRITDVSDVSFGAPSGEGASALLEISIKGSIYYAP